MEKQFIHAQDIDWKTVDEGVERKILSYDKQLMMVCVRFRKDAIGKLHQHVHRQVSYIESGSFEVSINGHSSILYKGDSFFVAPDVEHGVVALEESVLIDIFTPYREDFF
jgi:quercetin dioxygenase-like cupin family protein